jgi:hypothetical protein
VEARGSPDYIWQGT